MCKRCRQILKHPNFVRETKEGRKSRLAGSEIGYYSVFVKECAGRRRILLGRLGAGPSYLYCGCTASLLATPSLIGSQSRLASMLKPNRPHLAVSGDEITQYLDSEEDTSHEEGQDIEDLDNLSYVDDIFDPNLDLNIDPSLFNSQQTSILVIESEFTQPALLNCSLKRIGPDRRKQFILYDAMNNTSKAKFIEWWRTTVRGSDTKTQQRLR
ncbi:uncharacterized protein N7529_010644 [Penicillium soppii]|uniref:uncharacterized protein n=1 Tax=Penicillium soppii TaxID=69789 RepID=UPI0025490295|nr:uncharacterized protein N7529_010644 [Penicillium soppii]KAJ5851259.1 hypothetical protein N7529_010644 [Penicillium soppii]